MQRVCECVCICGVCAAALLAGFAFTQITTSLPSDLSFSLEMSYLIFAAVSLGLQLCVIITATFCCMWGLGLALRGPDGAYSVEEAIKSLKEEQGVIFSLFIAGMLSFFISNMLLLWCYYDTFVAAAATLLFASFLCLLLYFAVSLFIQLRVSSSIAVEGGIDALKVYADIKDLDACCTSPVLAADPADAAAAAAAAPATAAASPAAQAAAAAAERGRGTSFRPEQQPPSDER